MTKTKNLKYCSNLTPNGKCEEKVLMDFIKECKDCDLVACCWTCPDEIYDNCNAKEKCKKVDESNE